MALFDSVKKTVAGTAAGGATGAFFGGAADAYSAARPDVKLDNRNRYRARSYQFDESAFRNPNADATKRAIDDRIQGLRDRRTTQIEGPSAYTATQVPGQFRAQQQQAIDQLIQQSRGQGPSVADRQLRSAVDRSINAQIAAQASARGNPALAQRNIANQAAEIRRNASQDAATARIAEQLQAQQTLANTLQGARGLDVTETANLNQANLQARGQDVQQAIAQGELTSQERMQADALISRYTQMGIDVDQAQQMAAMELEKQRAQQQAIRQQINAGVAAGNQQAQTKLVGGAISGGAAALGKAFSSDRRGKTNIEPGEDAIRAAMDQVKPYSFEYKDPSRPGTTKGRLVGVMAQDLKKSKRGSDVVVDTPDGLGLDPVRAISAALAATADLHHRVKDLERTAA